MSKRKAVVLILYVKGASHTFRLLVDETEDAVVLAYDHPAIVESQPKVSRTIAVETVFGFAPLLIREYDFYLFVGRPEPEIDRVKHRLAVN